MNNDLVLHHNYNPADLEAVLKLPVRVVYPLRSLGLPLTVLVVPNTRQSYRSAWAPGHALLFSTKLWITIRPL